MFTLKEEFTCFMTILTHLISTDWKYYNTPVLISHSRQLFHKNSYLNQGLIYIQFMIKL